MIVNRRTQLATNTGKYNTRTDNLTTILDGYNNNNLRNKTLNGQVCFVYKLYLYLYTFN